MADIRDTLYLGDGVYASFDGYMIWLRVDREGRPQRIALEPAVLDNLIDYAGRIQAAVADQHAKAQGD